MRNPHSNTYLDAMKANQEMVAKNNISRFYQVTSPTTWWIAAVFALGMGHGSAGAVDSVEKSKLVRRLEEGGHVANFASISERRFRVHDYGANRDGRTIDMTAIQKTIDAAHAAGGGVVRNIYFHDIKMDGVCTAISCDMNSYPAIPAYVPESDITDHWRNLTEKVQAPERGIPEISNIRFENITVKNSKKAIVANAYPEKPIRDFVFKNVSLEVKNAGCIEWAADRDMTSVTLNGKPFWITTHNSTKMRLPATR